MNALNAEQRAVVESPALRKLVVAGAGSGKSSTLVAAILKTIERGADSVQRPCSASLSSPALKHQSKIYPPRYRGRVPWKIKMACAVRPDLEWLFKTRGTVALMDEVYECWVNMHGAVAAICRNGEKLGIKPAEFDVVEWHTQTPNIQAQR